MANRPGFIIKNSADVGGNFRIAEPDAVDFLLLGNNRYGVVAGCEVDIPVSNAGSATITGGTDGNILLVNGELRFAADQTVTLNTGQSNVSALDRFDLLIYDGIQSKFALLSGKPSADPTFPDLPANCVVLTAIFVPKGATSINRAYTQDKRILLQRSFQGSVGANDVFVANISSTGEQPYVVRGSGRTEWVDVSLERSAAQTLRVNGFLDIARSLNVQQGITVTGDVTSTGRLTGSNLRHGTNSPTKTATDIIGSLYVRDTDGAVFCRKPYGWVEFYADEYPPGTIIDSVLLPDDPFLGQSWLPMIGQTYTRDRVGRLWDLPVCANWRNLGAQTMTLPNLDKRVKMADSSQPPGSSVGTMTANIGTENLPAHTHFGGAAPSNTGSSGAHTHTATVSTAPAHVHPKPFAGGGYLTPFAGQGVKDSITALPLLAPGPTNIIAVDTTDYAGAHNHTVTFELGGAHSHALPAEQSVGGNLPFDITPARFVVTSYIKV